MSSNLSTIKKKKKERKKRKQTNSCLHGTSGVSPISYLCVPYINKHCARHWSLILINFFKKWYSTASFLAHELHAFIFTKNVGAKDSFSHNYLLCNVGKPGMPKPQPENTGSRAPLTQSPATPGEGKLSDNISWIARLKLLEPAGAFLKLHFPLAKISSWLKLPVQCHATEKWVFLFSS
jgi:hypothetical protein